MKTEYSTTETSKVRIAVLLSTCNGERYLPPLLDSVLGQSWPYWDLLVRDDGSTDGTVKILKTYRDRLEEAKSGNRMYVTQGENMGVVRSFFCLLDDIPYGYSGFAFCDQDDIWLTAKLERAAEYLHRHLNSTCLNRDNEAGDKTMRSFSDASNPCYKETKTEKHSAKPFLYHSRQLIMDSNEVIQGRSPLPRRTGFSNALIQNQVVGCTMLIDERLRRLIVDNLRNCSESDIDSVIMHDWWCYLLASCFGVTKFDPEPSILFRRHEHSVTPVTSPFFRAWKTRAAALRKRSWKITHITDQAALFQRLYLNRESGISQNGITPEKRRLTLSLLHLRSAGPIRRLLYVISGRHKRATLWETILFRMMIIMNRYV